MAQIQEFKCPHCGGKVEFDPSLQQMKCPFCDSVFTPQSVAQPDGTAAPPAETAPEEPQWESTDGAWKAGETGNMQTYVCRSCGGELLTEATTAATHCPYCGNPVVLTDRVSGTLRPDCIIPFQITEADAKAAMKKFAKQYRYTPRYFSRDNHLKEIKGVYVPFRLFDSDVYASATFDGRQVERWSDHAYNYTETSYYDVERAGEMRFENIPVDASRKMPDALMDSLEPFDAQKAVPFRTAYLSGFLADRYDVDADECKARAKDRTKSSAIAALRSTATGYDDLSVKQSEVRIVSGRSQYALYPVWLLNTQYLGRNFQFAMNGQTGKFIGDLPISKAKLACLFAAISLGVSGALFGLGFLIGLY